MFWQLSQYHYGIFSFFPNDQKCHLQHMPKSFFHVRVFFSGFFIIFFDLPIIVLVSYGFSYNYNNYIIMSNIIITCINSLLFIFPYSHVYSLPDLLYNHFSKFQNRPLEKFNIIGTQNFYFSFLFKPGKGLSCLFFKVFKKIILIKWFTHILFAHLCYICCSIFVYLQP